MILLTTKALGATLESRELSPFSISQATEEEQDDEDDDSEPESDESVSVSEEADLLALFLGTTNVLSPKGKAWRGFRVCDKEVSCSGGAAPLCWGEKGTHPPRMLSMTWSCARKAGRTSSRLYLTTMLDPGSAERW